MKYCPQCKRAWANGTICPYCDCALADNLPVTPTRSAACCEHMQFALRLAIIRTTDGLHFGTDVLPPLLTARIVACPWCGQRIEPITPL